jgi:uncharacterized integral membrane protein (TIGR00697 family)
VPAVPVLDLDARHARHRQSVLLVAVAAYVGVSLVANVMSARIVLLGPWAVDAGTLTYPLAFTLRDVVHKAGGRSAARTTIVVTAALNVGMVAAFWVAARLPADLAVGPQEEFGTVLVPVARIVLASTVAQLVAELLDTEVYHRVLQRLGRRRQWARVVVSNAVSIPVDSVVFAVVAFAGEVPSSTLFQIVGTNVLLKGATTALTWPLIYAVREPGDPEEPARADSPGTADRR